MKKIHLALILGLSIALNGCGALVKSVGVTQMTEAKGAIPPEFGQDPTSVLVCIIRNRKSYDKYMIKNVKKIYHGKYVFVSAEDLETPKYADRNKYRYVFDGNTTANRSSEYSPSSGYKNSTTYSDSYFVFDRLKDEHYHARFTSSFFSALIRAYMTNLEKKRQSMR
jgi:hypothetical protein